MHILGLVTRIVYYTFSSYMFARIRDQLLIEKIPGKRMCVLRPVPTFKNIANANSFRERDRIFFAVGMLSFFENSSIKSFGNKKRLMIFILLELSIF